MEQRWVQLSAKKQKLGRLATKIAHILIGKDLPSFQYNGGAQTHVVVVDCAAVIVPEIRLNEAVSHHTGYIGNLKTTTRAAMSADKIVRKAVSGMLPKNKTRRALLQHLHCELTLEHPFSQHFHE